MDEVQAVFAIADRVVHASDQSAKLKTSSDIRVGDLMTFDLSDLFDRPGTIAHPTRWVVTHDGRR
jgi:hypothetical protein